VPLLPVITASLAVGGRAVFGGILVAEAPMLEQSITAAGLEVIETRAEDGWWSAHVARR